ncbi:putative leader peptide [Streptomyces sp. NPDC000941]
MGGQGDGDRGVGAPCAEGCQRAGCQSGGTHPLPLAFRRVYPASPRTGGGASRGGTRRRGKGGTSHDANVVLAPSAWTGTTGVVQLTSLLVARLHVDLRRTASATCRA